MTYFDPKIYCKQNLKEADRAEMERYQEFFHVVLDYTCDRFQEDFCTDDSLVLSQIKTEIVDTFVELTKDSLGRSLDEHMVGLIDSYGDDVEVKEYEKPEFFFYDPGEDEEEDEEE